MSAMSKDWCWTSDKDGAWRKLFLYNQGKQVRAPLNYISLFLLLKVISITRLCLYLIVTICSLEIIAHDSLLLKVISITRLFLYLIKVVWNLQLANPLYR